MVEKYFAEMRDEQRAMVTNACAEIYGEDTRAWGDGTLILKLENLFALFVKFLPLFLGKEASYKAIGDGTLWQAFLAALANPQFVTNITGLVALIKALLGKTAA